MKTYGSGSDTDEAIHPNGQVPSIDPDEPEEEEEEEEYDIASLFSAPNYSDFIKTPPNSRAKVYERKTASMMKAGLIMSLNNEQYADAAAFLKHGPGFAKAAGNLAADDAKAASVIDMLTAPDSPYLMFGLVAAGFLSQIVRNHRDEVREAGQTWRERRASRKQSKLDGSAKVNPPITFQLFRREFKLPIRFRIKLPSLKGMVSAFAGNAQNPNALQYEVFSQPSVIRELNKLGISLHGPRRRDDAEDAA